MDAITYTKARQNFTETMNKVCDDHCPIIITRQNEKPVVVMSLEDYNSWEETIYLMKNPKNHEMLMKSIAEIKKGKVLRKSLIE